MADKHWLDVDFGDFPRRGDVRLVVEISSVGHPSIGNEELKDW
jgi:hypothetical protein